MKKLLIIVFIASCFGCSKSSGDPGAKETFHVSITTDYIGDKTLDVHDYSKTPRQTFTGTSFEGDFIYLKSTTISVYCQYPASITGHMIRVVITKDGNVIADKSGSPAVNAYIQSAP